MMPRQCAAAGVRPAASERMADSDDDEDDDRRKRLPAGAPSPSPSSLTQSLESLKPPRVALVEPYSPGGITSAQEHLEALSGASFVP